MKQVLAIASPLLVSLTILGCGGQAKKRLLVSGKVTLDGQSLPNGAIAFEPTEAGPSAGATIVDGAYSIAETRGPGVGKYRVQINSFQPTGNTHSPSCLGCPKPRSPRPACA